MRFMSGILPKSCLACSHKRFKMMSPCFSQNNGVMLSPGVFRCVSHCSYAVFVLCLQQI